MPSSTAWRIIDSRFSWFWRGTSFGSTSCHLNWYRIPPQEMTGIWSSVRPKRRYFMRERYDMRRGKTQSSKLKVQGKLQTPTFNGLSDLRNLRAFETWFLSLLLNFELRTWSFSGTRSVSDDELQFLPVRDQSALVSLAEEPPDRLAPFLPVIQRPAVHVHADKFVRQIASHIASELQRVLHRLGAMIEAVTNTGRENV